MADKTGIAWCDATWNPVSGCTKVSQGCKNCYAERLWPRLAAPGQPYEGRAFTEVACHPNRLGQPLRWKKPRRIFVNSMSDLFHEDVPDDFIQEVFAVMALADRHTFQILTKRPDRMRRLLNSDEFQEAITYVEGESPEGIDGYGYLPWPLPNVWLGVSVEDQETANERIPLLLNTPAAVRWLSIEPMLGPIDLREAHKAKIKLPRVDWIVVGGESGPRARPMQIEWVESIVDQCQAASVPVFVKQMGHNCTHKGRRVDFTGKGAVMSEWPENLRIQEFPR